MERPLFQQGCAATVDGCSGAGQEANALLFTPANRFQLLAREAVLRLAALPFLALLIKRPLNREGERLGSS